MKLFSFFKKRKETIEIDIPEVPVHESIATASDEDIYFERVEYAKEQFSLRNCKNNEEKKEKIINTAIHFEKQFEELKHNQNFLKLFARAANKDNKYHEKMKLLAKQIAKLKTSRSDFAPKLEAVKVMALSNAEFENIASQLDDLLMLYLEANRNVNFIKEKNYKHLKMSSFSICNDKTSLELELLTSEVEKLILSYKNIHTAYDHIFYNSGSLIVDTINALVECLQNSNNKELKNDYKYSYFLSSTIVLSLSFSEWVELFTKIKYVMRVASKVELFNYLKFKDLYSELEKRYILMLIFNEMQK